MDLKRLARYGAEVRIQELEKEIAAIRAAFPDIRRTTAASRTGRKVSAATRAKMRAAWARRNAGNSGAHAGGSGTPAETPKKTRTISAAGRARIAAAQKARWR